MRNFVRRGVQFALAASVVVASTGLSASVASAADPNLPPSTSTPGVPREFTPTSALARVNTLAMQEGALGAYTDKSTKDIVVVVPASGSSSFSKAAAASVGVGVPVRVETRNIDQHAIDTIQARLRDLRPAVPNTYSYGSYFDPEEGAVLVTSDAPQSAFSSVLSDYSGQVVYRHGSLSLQSRTNDIAPHWGGVLLTDGIVLPDGQIQQCSSGYAVQKGSYLGMVTAGHCFPLSDKIHDPSGNSFGQVNWFYNYPDTDAEILCGSGQPSQGVIYADPTGSTYAVKGYSIGLVGAGGYCVSGAFKLNTCGFTIDNINYQLCSNEYPGGLCANGLILVDGTYGPYPGDSGAPWYCLGGSGVSYGAYILGSHVGYVNGWYIVEPYTKVHTVYGVTVLVL